MKVQKVQAMHELAVMQTPTDLHRDRKVLRMLPGTGLMLLGKARHLALLRPLGPGKPTPGLDTHTHMITQTYFPITCSYLLSKKKGEKMRKMFYAVPTPPSQLQQG